METLVAFKDGELSIDTASASLELTMMPQVASIFALLGIWRAAPVAGSGTNAQLSAVAPAAARAREFAPAGTQPNMPMSQVGAAGSPTTSTSLIVPTWLPLIGG